MNLIQHYINGKVVSGDSKRKGKVFNPATGNQESEVLLGTKSDLVENREVSQSEGEAVAQQYDALFMETSSKENINVVS